MPRLRWSLLAILWAILLPSLALAQLYPGDDVAYDANTIDQTLPDGFHVSMGSPKFTKKWLVYNSGSVAWKDRFLIRQGSTIQGFGSARYTPIPDTAPGRPQPLGRPCIISVGLTANTPGHYRCVFKMGELYRGGKRLTHAEFNRLSKQGALNNVTERLCFPNKPQGVYIDGNID